jgi:peptide deformylase
MPPMDLIPIVRLGHPALRTRASALEPEWLADPEFQSFIDNMVETMRAAQGVGLAAPQVAHELRLFVYQAEGEGIPLTVAVNPEIEPLPGELVEDFEGCLSIPDLRGLVARHESLVLTALDRHGKPFRREASGFEARIIQHELDHLDGIVFLDRMQGFRSLAYAEELDEFGALAGSLPGR